MQRSNKNKDNATLTVCDTFESLQVFSKIRVSYFRGRIRSNLIEVIKIHLN